MATGNMIVSVVDVGQGQCTFVEIYDTGGKLIHTLLFDCGSDKKSNEVEINLQYIADKVSGMTTPAFDCLFFSHSDKDHISLTKGLLDKFSSSNKPKVKEVWYGGDRTKYTKYNFNILNYLETQGYCDTADLKAAPSNYTGYFRKTKRFNRYFWRSADKTVIVYPIVANVLSNDPDWDDNDVVLTGKTAEELNRVSIICGLYYAGTSYVICGDATNVTMASVNGVFSAGTTVFNKNIMTTLPHHGSRATGLAVKSSQDASDEAIDVVDTFSTLLKSQTLTISAYEKHHHPSLELMSHFIPTVSAPILRDPRLKEKNSHRIVAYLDLDLTKPSGSLIFNGFAQTFDTSTNTFATRYSSSYYEKINAVFFYKIGESSVAKAKGVTSGSVINEFASWVYTTSSSGGNTLEGKANLSSASFTVVPDTAVAFNLNGVAGKVANNAPPVRTEPLATKAHRPASPNSRFRGTFGIIE